jgi:hypothetical protein
VPLITSHPTVERVLGEHAEALAGDATGYRNHVYRVLSWALDLAPDLDRERAALALAWHDIGIWTDATWDYLGPSEARARAAGGDDGVALAIALHHRLRPWRGPHADLVEPLRRADLVDVSLGVVRFGLGRAQIRAVQAALPDAGFHARLVQLFLRELGRKPWRPMPMLRW